MSPLLDEFVMQLGFPLDDFQREAMEIISDGHSVVVCAPTGSGKTAIAEFAAHKAINDGKRILYTTPLKALSNQKFFDFKKQYGEENVGLLTGDLSVNRDARILVMTTEIFRNMLYGIQTDPGFLQTVGYVVLDECHYMNDAQRGTVWEESIIYCPTWIQVIALSATVANAQELTDWINQVHHDTRLVHSDFRPVPLRFSFYDRDNLMPLFDAPGRLNKRLKLQIKGNRFKRDQHILRPNKMIMSLHEQDMLPAIFFTFSRKDCDNYLRDTKSLQLLPPAERETIRIKIDEYINQNSYLKNNPMLLPIANGFASHHAGLLPGIKHLVEHLFQQGLIKVVFATETLAAGINMPARTTVITKISKRADEGHRLLHANEFLQMSGRAGRRGMDKIGYVVIASSPYEGAREAAILASSASDPLNSQFTPTYGMVLNLLQRHNLEQAEFLIRQSFGQFTAARRLLPLSQEIDQKSTELKKYLEFDCPYGVSDADFHGYLKTKGMLEETYHFIRTLKKQIKHHGPSPEILKQLSQEDGKKNSFQSTLETSPCKSCPVLHDHSKAEDRIRRLQKQLKQLNLTYTQQKDVYWQSFLSIYGLLKESDYLDENNMPTERGKLTAQIRAENEYFMAELVMSGLLDKLAPPQLAAVICAVTMDSNKNNLFSKLEPSPEVQLCLGKVSDLQRRVRRLQSVYGISAQLFLDPIATGLLEAWANDLSWERLVSSTNIAEGDLVRIIRRTNDMLRQISRLDLPETLAGGQPLVNPSLMINAKLALKLVDKPPVKDVEFVEIATDPEPIEPTHSTTPT